jgi:hypothetical protein
MPSRELTGTRRPIAIPNSDSATPAAMGPRGRVVDGDACEVNGHVVMAPALLFRNRLVEVGPHFGSPA